MVKPLFGDETVVATVNPVVVGAVNTSPGINVDKALVPASQVKALTTIDDNTIDSLGDQTSVQLSGLSQQLLSTVRASDADVFGEKLNQLVVVAKGMDPKALGKGGLLSKITGLFGTVKEKLLAQYSTCEHQMDAIVGELDKAVALHAKRVDDFEGMYNTNYAAHQALEAAVAHGTDLQRQLEAGLAQMKTQVNPDSFAAQRMQDLDQKIQRLEKRLDDLSRGMLLAKQTAPEIRLLQDNARTLVTKFKDIKTVTIPAWKTAFTLYLASLEQKKGAALANAVSDATDAAFTAQADLLRQNTVDIAKAKQRAVVSIDVIQHVQDQLLGSFDDMQKIADEGRKARKDAEPKLKAMEQQLIARFVPKS